jgi:Protein of unknown function C-terminus (DUF2399)/Protein of unknown function N-terminus (DUF3323)
VVTLRAHGAGASLPGDGVTADRRNLVPPSLSSPGMTPVWEAVRDRLERRGVDNRGRVRLPDLTSAARLSLEALIGRRPGATVDLAALERALRGLGVGDDLVGALRALGYEASDAVVRRRAERRLATAARAAAREEASSWPEAWAGDWIDEVIRAGGLRGLDPESAVDLVRQTRTVLDALDAPGVDPPGDTHAHPGDGGAQPGSTAPMSRVDLAARLFGSAHALDTGTRLEAAATRALAHRAGAAKPRDLWERAGAHLDLTSAPVLTWRLPLVPGSPSSPVATLAADATEAGLPLHLTQFALRRHPAAVAPGTDVLVVENPRIVEAAAQLGVRIPVVATNGQPSGAVRLLLDQLLGAGAALRYHGDFDAAGLGMCGRMALAGLTPWRMDATSYRAAVAQAEADDVALPIDPLPCPPTPWDPALAQAFGECGLVVHEERLLPDLLLG